MLWLFLGVPYRMSAIQRHCRQRTLGFTLIELMVTIAVIAVMAAIALPAISKAKARARSIQCLSNIRQFAMTMALYAQDHDDAVLPNQGGKNVPLGLTWVMGWMGAPGPDRTNTVFLQNSLVGPYVSDVGVWRCPAAAFRNGRTSLVRTLSLNMFIGGGTNAPLRLLRDTELPPPSEVFTFVEERDDTINDACFAMQWDFDFDNPASWILRDKPAVVHAGGANLAFADGHASRKPWKDPRTQSAPRDDARIPNNADILWLQQHAVHRNH